MPGHQEFRSARCHFSFSLFISLTLTVSKGALRLRPTGFHSVQYRDHVQPHAYTYTHTHTHFHGISHSLLPFFSFPSPLKVFGWICRPHATAATCTQCSIRPRSASAPDNGHCFTSLTSFRNQLYLFISSFSITAIKYEKIRQLYFPLQPAK